MSVLGDMRLAATLASAIAVSPDTSTDEAAAHTSFAGHATRWADRLEQVGACVEAALGEAAAYTEGQEHSDAFRRIVNLLQPAREDLR